MSILTQKLIGRKLKLLPDETSHGLGVHDENHAKRNGVFTTVLG